MMNLASGDTPSNPVSLPRVFRGSRMRVVSVTGGKGGVGKSSIAVNLALGLERLGGRVLLLDGDLGLANADQLLGVQASSTLWDVMQNRLALTDAVIETPWGVSLLPACSGRTEMAELDDIARASLIRGVKGLSDHFDFVIVDTAAGIGDTAVGLAQAGDVVLAVATPDPTSVRDAFSIMKVLAKERGVRRISLVANMVSSPAEGMDLFRRVSSVTSRFLPLTLGYAGAVVRSAHEQGGHGSQPAHGIPPGVHGRPADRQDRLPRSLAGQGGLAERSGARGNAMTRAPDNRAPVSEEKRNELAKSYLPIVRKIAMGLSNKAPPSVSMDDLIGAGLIGLMDAASRYDPERKEQFGAFVATRVRGAMIDELRAADPLSRDLRVKSNVLSKTIHDLKHELSRQPTEDEIIERLDMPRENYHQMLVQLQQATFLSPVNVEQAIEGARGYPDRVPGNPQDSYLFAELQERLAGAIGELSEKEQRVLAMYYKDDLSLKEIGDKFGFTDSRACQIRSQAIHRLRAMLQEEEDDG